MLLFWPVIYKSRRNMPNRKILNTLKQIIRSYSNREVVLKHARNSQHCPVNTDGGKPGVPGWDIAKPFSDIPGPKPLPLIGNVWRFLPIIGDFYKMDFVDLHKKFYKEYGDITIVKGIGRQMVILFNPNDIETLYRQEGSCPIRIGLPSITYYRTVLRNDVFNGYGGLLTIQGPEWLEARHKVNPFVIKPEIIAKYIPHLDEIGTDLVDKMKNLASTGKNNELPADFFDVLLTWSLECIAGVALDHHFGFLRMDEKPSEEAQQLIRSVLKMNSLSLQLDVLPSLWKHISTPTWRKYVKEMDNITDIVFKYLKESLAKIEDKNDIDDNNLSAIQRVSKIDHKLAVATAMDLLIGGIDTTSRTLGATLYYLAKNKDKQDILRKELTELLPNNEPVTQQTLLKAQYLRAVVKETTRIAGAAVGTTRTTVKDLVLAGYQIPTGTEVITSNLMLSNQDKHFSKATEFLPERWLRSTKGELSYKNTHPFVFLPFGYGPRSCLGKRIAHLELEIAIAKVIRNLELSWEHEDMTFSMVLLYGINDPLKLKVKALT